MFLKRHDAPSFLPLGVGAMMTVCHIPGWFAQSFEGRLSPHGTLFILVRRALAVTSHIPPMRADMARKLASSSSPHPPKDSCLPCRVCPA